MINAFAHAQVLMAVLATDNPASGKFRRDRGRSRYTGGSSSWMLAMSLSCCKHSTPVSPFGSWGLHAVGVGRTRAGLVWGGLKPSRGNPTPHPNVGVSQNGGLFSAWQREANRKPAVLGESPSHQQNRSTKTTGNASTPPSCLFFK